MMETSQQKASDTIEQRTEDSSYLDGSLDSHGFVHLAPGGVVSEDPHGTGQFNGKQKKF
jgi:hypothetical protein